MKHQPERTPFAVNGTLLRDAETSQPPMSMKAWMTRDLPELDLLLGFWLSTTSRVLLVAETGLGKSTALIAAGMRVAGGKPFLHWEGRRHARVLYIDGEMSNRLLKHRLSEEIRRLGSRPDGFYALCAADLEDFQPLNTAEGQEALWKVINEINPDLIIFDSVMCLIAGNMIEEGPWAEVMPLVRTLTQRNIGQIWVHHTGHQGGRSYGTKTREWQMDAVIMLEPRNDSRSNVSFKLTFSKARERTPDTRNDFQDAMVALIDDEWTVEVARSSRSQPKISPKATTVLKALAAVIDRGQITRLANGKRAATDDDWRRECESQGIFNAANPASSRAQLSKYRTQLIDAGLIECGDKLNWLVPDGFNGLRETVPKPSRSAQAKPAQPS